MFDPEKFGEAMGAAIREATAPLLERIKALEAREPIPGPAGKDGERGPAGADGANGIDGMGLAGAMIDRDGALQITMTNGEVKNLGPVVGKDGSNGADGLSLESFEMEYIQESHEISIKASVQGRTKELRYPAGGIHSKGYWGRNGGKAKAGEAWIYDGSLWIALKDCNSNPGLNDDAWVIAARKGKDGERGQNAKPVDNSPIKLGV